MNTHPLTNQLYSLACGTSFENGDEDSVQINYEPEIARINFLSIKFSWIRHLHISAIVFHLHSLEITLWTQTNENLKKEINCIRLIKAIYVAIIYYLG